MILEHRVARIIGIGDDLHKISSQMNHLKFQTNEIICLSVPLLVTIVSVRDTLCQFATKIHKNKQNQPALLQHQLTR